MDKMTLETLFKNYMSAEHELLTSKADMDHIVHLESERDFRCEQFFYFLKISKFIDNLLKNHMFFFK